MTMLKEEETSIENNCKLANNSLNNNNQQSNSNNNNNNNNKEQQNTQKDRTLFCINIDQRCTEDILYELFLQAGPIENIVRKADRNGNLICLITYKNIESCDCAIKLFNGISLFNQSIKVQLSQINNQNTLNSRKSSSNLNNANSQVQASPVNYYAAAHNNNNNNGSGSHNRHRQLSVDNQSAHPQTTPLIMPQPQQLYQFMLQSLSSSPIIPSNNMNHLFNQMQQNSPFFQSPQIQPLMNNNYSRPGHNYNDYDNDHHSRRSNGDDRRRGMDNRRDDMDRKGYNRQMDSSSASRDRRSYDSMRNRERSRSRSPLDKRRRR